MKKLIAFLTCLLLTGCSPGNSNEGLGKEVYPVVDRYLECSAAGKWQEVYETLSGEALAEARANSGRVKAEEKILRKSFGLTPVCDGIAEVAADFTVGAGGEFDRLAYKFRLKRTGDKWLIYKTEYGGYIHGELRPGQLPPGVGDNIRAYIEMPFRDKNSVGQKFLAGKTLQESRKAGLLPVDLKIVKEQEKISVRVKAIRCLGVSDGYTVTLVSYEVTNGETVYALEALVDVLDVNGSWKISRLDITRT
ncbi:MAG: hypothetical protein ACOY4I_08375 [Bacillota bacterium]